MDIDFALLLFVLVVITGILWGIARFLLPGKVHGAVEYTASFFPILLVVFLLRSFLYEPFQIPSGSMIPTLEIGDFIVVNKFRYGVRLPIVGTKIIPVGEPERGDVMVFIPPHDHRYFIKRVVGLPGDQILIIDNRLFINGEEVPQDFVARIGSVSTLNGTASVELRQAVTGQAEHQVQVLNPASSSGAYFEGRVSPGHYFMMGDNRDNSSDSRDWGEVPESNIVGKAVAIWMHWQSGSLPSFGRVGAIR
jgi:signal peptidase I